MLREIRTGISEGMPDDATPTRPNSEGEEPLIGTLENNSVAALPGSESKHPSGASETEEISRPELIKDIESIQQQLGELIVLKDSTQRKILEIGVNLDLPADMQSFNLELAKSPQNPDLLALSYARKVQSPDNIQKIMEAVPDITFPDIAKVGGENITLEDLLPSVASRLNKIGAAEASTAIRDFFTAYAELWSRYDQHKGEFVRVLDVYKSNASNLRSVFSDYESQMRFLERLEHNNPYSGIEVDQLRNVLQAGLRNSAELYNQIAGGIVASSEEMLMVLRKLEDLVYGLNDQLDSAKAQIESENVREEEGKETRDN